MFSRWGCFDLFEMACYRDFCGIIWFHQFIWGFLSCCLGIFETIAIYWTNSSSTVYRAGEPLKRE